MSAIPMHSNLKVVLEGRGALVLRPSNHVATGGEGSVYVLGDTAIKIYQDPKRKMAWNRVREKISFFQKHNHPYVVAPQGVVTTDSGDPLGYYMPYVRDGDHGGNAEAVARVFTNDGRTRMGLADVDSSTLVERMREIVMFAHANDAITVDANELGYFVVPHATKGPEPRMIDVDSWVIGGQRPSVLPIMPSIRDWHSASPFGEMQDWFAWAVVTFQVYVGLHPYKGTLDGYTSKDLELRMKENASVFAPKVRLNRAVRDFAVVPDLLLEWYEATFQHGERSQPPSPLDKKKRARRALTMRVVTASGGGALVFKKLYGEVDDPVVRVYACGVVLLKSGALVDLATKRTIGTQRSGDCEVVNVQGGWLVACGGGGRKMTCTFVHGVSLKEESLPVAFAGYRFVRFDNRLFVVTDKGLSELTVRMFAKPVLSVGQTWGAMVNGTRWFDGVGIQDAFGATYFIAPFGADACAHVRVPELDGLRAVAGKAGDRFVAVVGVDAQGQLHKVEITLSKDYRSYTVWQRDVDSLELNMAMIPTGVCVTVVEDGRLSVFVPANGTVKNIQDKDIATDMTLANWGDNVVYLRNGVVWSLHMK